MSDSHLCVIVNLSAVGGFFSYWMRCCEEQWLQTVWSKFQKRCCGRNGEARSACSHRLSPEGRQGVQQLAPPRLTPPVPHPSLTELQHRFGQVKPLGLEGTCHEEVGKDRRWALVSPWPYEDWEGVAWTSWWPASAEELQLALCSSWVGCRVRQVPYEASSFWQVRHLSSKDICFVTY